MTMYKKKIRIAVPYTDRLFTFPNIGFSTLAQALWDTVDDTCEVLKLHESELLERDDYDVVFLMREIGISETFFEHFLKTGKRIAVWRDDLHSYSWRVPYPPKRLVRIFERADLIFVTYFHHFCLWKSYGRFRDKVVWLPWSVPDWIFECSKAWQDRRDRILLAGYCSVQYPLRKRLFKYTRRSGKCDIDALDHRGYASYKAQSYVTGREFYRLLGSYKGAIATTASTRVRVRRVIDYIVSKYFELPACGCVPFMEVAPDLGELGFVDGVNFISITRWNYKKRLSFIYSKEAEKVAGAAQDLIRSRHTHRHRTRLIIDSMANLIADI